MRPGLPTASAVLVLLPAAAAAQAPPRYDLRPGDRLVYRAAFDRALEGEGLSSATRVEWDAQVVVLGEGGGTARVGFQRTRRRAELLRSRSEGRDRLREERLRFAEDLARRPAVVAEGNWLWPDGRAELPWSAVPEWTSELLPFVHEIEPLPARAVAPGDRWTGASMLGLAFRSSAPVEMGGERCFRFEGESGSLRLRLWFGPETASLLRLEYEGRYPVFGAEATEKLVLERVSRRRGEDPRDWLADPDARQAALAALLVTQPPTLGPDVVYPLLASGDAAVQRQALALAWRERWPSPSPETLGRLQDSDHPRVRALATRLAGGAAVPAPPADLLTAARMVRAGGPLPEWRCGDDPERAEHALLAQRAKPEVPGSTVRLMRTGPVAGWPYVVHVPEDYRGDEPFPLLLALGGGPGRALATAQGAFRVVDRLEYLVVYPQASGMWWDEGSVAGVSALVSEVLADYAVDTNRVYLTGFSNGGTGTLLYSALWGHRLAAAAPLMGAGSSVVGVLLPSAAGLTRLPLLLAHGDRDQVIPVAATRDAVKAIRREDPTAPVEEHILAGRGHDLRLGTDDDLVLPFFERHRRDPFPRHVRLRARDLSFARSFWVEVVEKGSGTAEVDGDIDGSAVVVRTRNVKRLRLRLRRELLADPRALRVRVNGREAFAGPLEEDCGLLLRSWRETGDPFLAHSWERTFGADGSLCDNCQ